MREEKGEKRRDEAREDQACIIARYIGERERDNMIARKGGEEKRERQ